MQKTMYTVSHKTKSSAVAKRLYDCCVCQFWLKYNWKRIFPNVIGLSSTTVIIGFQIYQTW